MNIRIYLKQGEVYTEAINYTLTIISINKCFKIDWVKLEDNPQLIFDPEIITSTRINIPFCENIFYKNRFKWSTFFDLEPLIYFKNGGPDYLSTIFYMVNAFQEYDAPIDELDKFGRFQYDYSYQAHFKIATSNLVQTYINEFCKNVPVLKGYAQFSRKSTIFMTHDIDYLKGDLKVDGLWAIKRGRFDILLKIIVAYFIGNHDWSNIDKILKINSEYEIKACFFWLLNKPKTAGIKNSDYSPNEVKGWIEKTKINGLHKSSSNDSISSEKNLFDGISPYVRYHFLKYTIPKDWRNLQESNIKLDAGFGFYDQIGFRNSFGMPIKPFDLKDNQALRFLLVPLNIMDGTLSHYSDIPTENTANTMIEFIEKNRTDSVINMIWHNHYFTNYTFKGYVEEYKKLLCYLREVNIKSTTPEEILKEYDR